MLPGERAAGGYHSRAAAVQLDRHQDPVERGRAPVFEEAGQDGQKMLGQRDVAAVCLEDKLFPKTNSFLGERQPLADVDEFCGKIKAGKDSATDSDFSIVARVEALIAGRGLDEALRRAEAYHAAGADAILIHSKRQTPDEIVAFAAEWGRRSPLVIVPTMYYATPTDLFRQAGISVVIWANQNLRAAISAMREVSRRIRAEESLVGVEGAIASVREVFALAANDLRSAEADGEWIGLAKLSARGAALVRAELDSMRADGSLTRASLLEMLSRLIAVGHPIGVVYVLGGWLDVDDAFDLARARNFT